jgi:predicted dehydrogenase
MPTVNDMLRDMPLRVGILGYSDIACRKFIPALLKSSKAALTAIASRERTKVVPVASGLNVVYMDYQEMLSSAEVDLVYISLPNHLHEEWTIRALKAGKHVLCEKPLGLTLQSVNRMVACAEKHGRLLFENLMYLQHPQHAAVKQLITANQLGRVTRMTTFFRFPGPAAGDFRHDPFCGGGAFHDLNRYPLSAALYFLRGTSFCLQHCLAEAENGLNRSAQATFITSASEEFSFSIGFGFSYESFYEIECERGRIMVDRAYTTPADMVSFIKVTCDGNDASFNVPPCDHFLVTIDHVCRLITTGGTFMEQHKRSRTLAELADNVLTAIAGRIV